MDRVIVKSPELEKFYGAEELEGYVLGCIVKTNYHKAYPHSVYYTYKYDVEICDYATRIIAEPGELLLKDSGEEIRKNRWSAILYQRSRRDK